MKSVPSTTRLLVAIANHGTGSRRYLDQLLAAYRSMPIKVSIVILSNVPKDLGPDVEVRVGVPSSNPWSLPFAHRPLFRERLNDYDLFIYSEDDTLVTWANIESFLEALETLEEGETPGFLRTEQAPDGSLSFSTCHSFFRWRPGSTVRRGGKLWAKYSNEHAACFIATRDQLKQAIARGGFPNEPHEGRFDMLCSAATDIYTTGGLKRLICLDQIDRYSLPHLPNKYIGKMGLPETELKWQIEALRSIEAGNLTDVELLQPETKLPGCFGSKHYREEKDPNWDKLIGDNPQDILIWGAGDGHFEKHLADQGHRISIFPLDSIMGECCRRRGLTVLPPTKSGVPETGKDFDVILLSDVLHLLDDPAETLRALRPFLKSTGKIAARIPNLNDVRMIRRRRKDARYRLDWNRATIGAQPLTAKDLRQIGRRAGYGSCRIVAAPTPKLQNYDKLTLGLFSAMLSPRLYLVAMP